jgi:uncharacterized protein (TIGR02757 family)
MGTYLMETEDLKDLLNSKSEFYNNSSFIESDPVQIPHSFELKEDIEIAGFLAATLAWGKRASTINSARKMMVLMGNSPYDFVMSHSEYDLERLDGFVHRTFNARDFKTMIKGFQNIYINHNGMEATFRENIKDNAMHHAIHAFRNAMLEVNHERRYLKHIADPLSNSAAKRIHLFLRWMIRKDKIVDLGTWETISPSVLSCPLDVHSGRTARELNLLTRKYDDRKAVEELDASLRLLDANDPAKYDFALFGLSVEKF